MILPGCVEKLHYLLGLASALRKQFRTDLIQGLFHIEDIPVGCLGCLMIRWSELVAEYLPPSTVHQCFSIRSEI